MKEHARNGKIARLPQTLREEINLRLADGATARKLVAWLNGLPEVQALVRDQFDGHPIREQNISQWRNRGYEDWLRQQEAAALAAHLYEQAESIEERVEKRLPMCEVLKIWLTARYAVETRVVERTEGPEGWRRLRQMCTDIVKLQRMEHDAKRLEIERERTEICRMRVELQREKMEMQRERRAATGKRREEVEENAAGERSDEGQSIKTQRPPIRQAQGGLRRREEEKIVPVPRPVEVGVEPASPHASREEAKPWKEPLGAAA